jgi:hypothetical protein
MKKLLLVSSLVFVLSACGLKSSDFTSMYNDHAHAQIVAIEEALKSLGLYQQEQSVGSIQAAVNVPIMMSGSMGMDIDAKVNGKDADISMKNLRLAYESMMGSGLLSFDTLGLISKNGDTYVFFDGLKDENILTDQIREVLKKYTKTWLSWTQSEMASSLSEEERLANTILENLSKMTLSDIEWYIKKYPIWKQTGDLGMSGSLHMYSIDLDKVAVIELIAEVTEDLTNSGMTAEDRTTFQNALDQLTLTGTLGFDPKNARTAALYINLSESGSEVGILDIQTSESKTQIRLTSTAEGSEVVFGLEKNGTRNEMNLTLSQWGVEMGKVTGYIDRTGDTLKELALDVTAQGVSVGLKHTVETDGKFKGSLALPVGSLTWEGAMTEKKLTWLTVKGTAPMWSVSMELTPSAQGIAGPLSIKEGGTELFRANVGLIVEEWKFGFQADMLSLEDTETPTTQAHVEYMMTLKTTPFYGNISAPTWTKSLQSFFDELEISMPADSFTPVDSSDTSFDSEALEGMSELEGMNPEDIGNMEELLETGESIQ